jgi:predicted aspartyl protease
MRWMAGVFLVLAAAASAEDAAKAPATPPASPAPAPDCRLRRNAILDMEMDDTGRITVPVTLNGTLKRMMIDTGAQWTMISAAAVKELNLTPRATGVLMMGVGRVLGTRAVTIDEFRLGQLKGSKLNFLVLEEALESSGLLGSDFLSRFDADYDFANARLNLFEPAPCPGNVLYWTNGNYGVVPFEVETNHIMVQVMLDGQPVKAGLDTGAADTLMSLDRASNAFDLDGDKLKKSRHYPFKTLSFGEVSVGNPAIQLVPDEESGVMGHHSSDLQMIIGMGVLRRLHLYVSYKEKKIYVTPATQY